MVCDDSPSGSRSLVTPYSLSMTWKARSIRSRTSRLSTCRQSSRSGLWLITMLFSVYQSSSDKISIVLQFLVKDIYLCSLSFTNHSFGIFFMFPCFCQVMIKPMSHEQQRTFGFGWLERFSEFSPPLTQPLLRGVTHPPMPIFALQSAISPKKGGERYGPYVQQVWWKHDLM